VARRLGSAGLILPHSCLCGWYSWFLQKKVVVAMLDLLGKIQCCLWDSIGEMGMSFVFSCRFVALLGTHLFVYGFHW
jgi:hypothetical protein